MQTREEIPEQAISASIETSPEVCWELTLITSVGI